MCVCAQAPPTASVHRRAQRERASGGAGKKKRSTEADTSPPTQRMGELLNMSRRAGVPAASLVWAASTSRRARGSVGCRWPRRPGTSTAAATGPAHLLRSAEVAVAPALAEAAPAAPVPAATGLAHPPKVLKRSTAQGRRGELGRSSRPSAAPTRRPP